MSSCCAIAAAGSHNLCVSGAGGLERCGVVLVGFACPVNESAGGGNECVEMETRGAGGIWKNQLTDLSTGIDWCYLLA